MTLNECFSDELTNFKNGLFKINYESKHGSLRFERKLPYDTIT